MNIPLDLFFESFFGPEGNTLEDSFITFKDDQPVGLILGGIRAFDGDISQKNKLIVRFKVRIRTVN